MPACSTISTPHCRGTRTYTGIFPAGSLANIQAYFRFTGKASHAAASPHLGRSALDAVELMNVGVNYLREHMLPEARVHYAVTNTGGLSPNVVQANAEVLYLVRAARNDQAAELFERVKNVARGAAMMTDCRLEIVFDKACSNLLENAVLNQVMYRHLQSIGTAGFDADDAALADAYQRQTLTAQDIETSSRSLNQAWRDPKALFDGIDPYARQGPPDLRIDRRRRRELGHADRAMPYELLRIRHAAALVAVGRARQDTARTQGDAAGSEDDGRDRDRPVRRAGHAAQAKAELLERRGGRPYVCPIPDDVALPFRR